MRPKTWYDPAPKKTQLFPAVKAGLHCGIANVEDRNLTIIRLFPAVKAGLHCGLVTPTVILTPASTALPGREGRAPLRLAAERDARKKSDHSSRP